VRFDTPSIALGTGNPCQCTMVSSGRRLSILTRRVLPSVRYLGSQNSPAVTSGADRLAAQLEVERRSLQGEQPDAASARRPGNRRQGSRAS
jgi:hypothetical protein